MEYKGWLGTLSDETRERVFVAMRAIRAKSDYYLNKSYALRAPHGQIAAGCADFNEFVRGESLAAYLRAIGKGSTPTEALADAKSEARLCVAKHNVKRKDLDWKRDEGTADNTIDYQHRLMMDAVTGR